uniref:Secreted protein n=1 Tax=Ixodes ricinus TaxID=34613 RepID=A0A6B0UC16_IXORI
MLFFPQLSMALSIPSTLRGCPPAPYSLTVVRLTAVASGTTPGGTALTSAPVSILKQTGFPLTFSVFLHAAVFFPTFSAPSVHLSGEASFSSVVTSRRDFL